jgi:hypothetical protein
LPNIDSLGLYAQLPVFTMKDHFAARARLVWLARVTIIALGVLLAASALFGFLDGRLWITNSNPRRGFEETSTLDFAIIGLVIVFLGAFPWGKLKSSKRRPRNRLALAIVLNHESKILIPYCIYLRIIR